MIVSNKVSQGIANKIFEEEQLRIATLYMKMPQITRAPKVNINFQAAPTLSITDQATLTQQLARLGMNVLPGSITYAEAICTIQCSQWYRYN
jgi:hypothetical protein